MTFPRGFHHCLTENGEVYDTLKYGWMQGRQVGAPFTISRCLEIFRTTTPEQHRYILAVDGPCRHGRSGLHVVDSARHCSLCRVWSHLACRYGCMPNCTTVSPPTEPLQCWMQPSKASKPQVFNQQVSRESEVHIRTTHKYSLIFTY